MEDVFVENSTDGYLHVELDAPLVDSADVAKPRQGTKRKWQSGRSDGDDVALQWKKMALNMSRMVAFSMTGYIFAGGPFGASVGFVTACMGAVQDA